MSAEEDEKSMTQQGLLTDFQRVTQKIRDVATNSNIVFTSDKLEIMVGLKGLATEMLTTYKGVEQMHANVRVAEAQARTAQAKAEQARIENIAKIANKAL